MKSALTVLLFCVIPLLSKSQDVDFEGRAKSVKAPAHSLYQPKFAIRARPFSMLVTPLTWGFFRNGNIEVGFRTGKSVMSFIGVNYAYVELVNANNQTLLLQQTSVRGDLQIYFPGKNAESEFEGLHFGPYYKFTTGQNKVPPDPLFSATSHIFGGLLGYQFLIGRHFIIDQSIGVGAGLLFIPAQRTYGPTLDFRLGLSFGYLI